ncbi:MAG: murein L,D-transpeptidase [Kofleriaceae bacterium]|nr:murein L,D-transpeptidase [Kofleriaceae bacterium]
MSYWNICARFSWRALCLSILLLAQLPSAEAANRVPTNKRARRVIARVSPILKHELKRKGLEMGAPIFVRIFKDPGRLEVWVQGRNGKFRLFKSYEICFYSGDLGPKQKEGDMQSPEGFYLVKARQLNPGSSYHLSFNLGFPNAYDRSHGRTGKALMVHGNCVSIGCYAMTDRYIEEIFTLAHAALKNGQAGFQVHSFPFVLSEKNLRKRKASPWQGFWGNLKEGHDIFEATRRPPRVRVRSGVYVFRK